MKSKIFFRCAVSLIGLFLVYGTTYAQSPSHYYVAISTNKGGGVIKLYNETPLHRDNFVTLVKQGFYDSLLFHRVIHNFMIQGGDPDSKNARPDQSLGHGGTGARINSEFRENLIHKRGAVAAARDNNPQKASSGSQFYITQGRVFSAAALDSLEEFRLKKKLSKHQRDVYQTIGGVPHLDGEYTVFGEMTQGTELIDSVASVKTDRQDRPLEDQRMAMRVLNLGEALDIELGTGGAHRQRGLIKRLFGKKLTSDYTLN